MANVIDYLVDVLATSPEEINRIAARLKVASDKLVDWVAQQFKQDRNETAETLPALVGFEPVKNLFDVSESVNKARKFRNSFQRSVGVVNSHLYEVSKEFAAALFLVEYFDLASSYSGKMIILAGKLLHEVYDGNHHVQGMDWALIDVFAPFRAEYELGVPFGSLWKEWLEDMNTTVGNLSRDQHEQSHIAPEPLDMTFDDLLPNEVREPKPGQPGDLVQKRRCDGVWRTLCNVCHQPVPASFESYCEDGDEDFGLVTDRVVCFEVIPWNVTIESCMFCLGMGAEENWRRKKSERFIICAGCLAKLGVVPTQLPLSPMPEDGSIPDRAIVPASVVEAPEDEVPTVRPEDLLGLEDID